MKIEKEVFIKFTLTEDEAERLMCLVQNTVLENETNEEQNFRRKIFESIKQELDDTLFDR